ncbi:MAG: three-Cys-motif partner protein TcmP [candidate division Zixibacteria bacterium]|nr:three-Cys-motif partner protein TcmP [candidate division Zixibacteria bacterium]
MEEEDFDHVGVWTEVKLDIISRYAEKYAKILDAQRKRGTTFKFYYIDACAGKGKHISKTSGQAIQGSPLNALKIDPPFSRYYFIDLDPETCENLRILKEEENRRLGQAGKPIREVEIINEDCNRVLPEKILPEIRYSDYKRALCFLDPYNLGIDWEVLHLAGRLKTIDIFLNFSIMDANMNILFHNKEAASPEQKERLNRVWGDNSWEELAYSVNPDLFGHLDILKQPNTVIARAFADRLRKVAGFKYVPTPIPMRNSQNSPVYYLFFASQNSAANDIASYIFRKYGKRLMN